MTDTYTCANCHVDFTSERPDEEALDEMKEDFGEIPAEERAVVCDDCYTKFMEWYQPTPPDKPSQSPPEPPDHDPDMDYRWGKRS